MEINGTNGFGGAAATAPTGSENALDREAFMKLLVTQLRHQDPLDPMDPREMISQLSELTSVEQLQGIQDRLATLSIGTAGIANTQASGLIGQHVVADASRIRLDIAGTATGVFQLQQPAENVTVTIRDAAGNTVRTLELGAVAPGSREVVWDGQSDAGQRLQPGLYRMEISARGAGNVPLAATTQVSGIVDAISYEGGFPELIIAGQHVMMGDVQEVSAAR